MTTPRDYLDLAARLARRGAGRVEPNPMVGAVIVKAGRVIGLGHHRRYGGPHAEREALAQCRARAEDPRGATVFVTLEPCRHHGKTPPCTDALIEAGVARVVAARRDPGTASGGGAEVLRGAGIEVEFSDASANAVRVSDPFVKRVTTGLPWVIAKWAQFEDGRMVTRPGEPRWISGELARRRVHRLRARVDAVVTGIGTVLADDPLLTVRGVKARRTPARVVLDTRLRMPPGAALVRTAREAPVIVFCGEAASASAVAAGLRERGVEVLPVPESGGGVEVAAVLRALAQRGATNVLLEAGPRLLRCAFEEGLVDEAVVHVAGEGRGRNAAADAERAPEPERAGLACGRARTLGGDVERLYVRMP